MLCYGCEIWSITGGTTALAELEHLQIGFLKMLLGVQTHTTTLHVLAEFGRFPLQGNLSWHALAGKYLERLEKMDADWMLKQAFIADCSLGRTAFHGDSFLRLGWRTTWSQAQQRIIHVIHSTKPFLFNLPSVSMWSSWMCRFLARQQCTEASG